MCNILAGVSEREGWIWLHSKEAEIDSGMRLSPQCGRLRRECVTWIVISQCLPTELEQSTTESIALKICEGPRWSRRTCIVISHKMGILYVRDRYKKSFLVVDPRGEGSINIASGRLCGGWALTNLPAVVPLH